MQEKTYSLARGNGNISGPETVGVRRAGALPSAHGDRVVGRHEVELEDVASLGCYRVGLEIERRRLGLIGHGRDLDDMVIGGDAGRKNGHGEGDGLEGHHFKGIVGNALHLSSRK